jgi:hypothetical protein
MDIFTRKKKFGVILIYIGKEPLFFQMENMKKMRMDLEDSWVS